MNRTAQSVADLRLWSSTVVARNVLAMPPSIIVEGAKDFSLHLVEAIINGRADEILDLTRTNLWP
jgi:pyruvate dehydrogenase (quinone)